MKKATTRIMLAVVILLIALAGCSESAEKPVRGSSTSVSWSDKGYQSAEEMISGSDAAIIGEVTDSYTEVRNNIVFTRQVVKAITVNKGELKEGDCIEVLQTGGTDGGMETAPLSEVPFMEHGKEYALCLRFSQPSEKYGQYYLISGGYQGIAEIVPSGEEKDIAFADYFTDAFENSLSARRRHQHRR